MLTHLPYNIFGYSIFATIRWSFTVISACVHQATNLITKKELLTMDPDTDDGQLVYEITTEPKHGFLESKLKPGNPITTFTQGTQVPCHFLALMFHFYTRCSRLCCYIFLNPSFFYTDSLVAPLLLVTLVFFLLRQFTLKDFSMPAEGKVYCISKEKSKNSV